MKKHSNSTGPSGSENRKKPGSEAPGKFRKKSGNEEKRGKLQEIDHKIIDLIIQRNKALQKQASSKKNNRFYSTVEAGQEKMLWQVWEARAERDGLDKPLLRRLFNLINDLGYKTLEQGHQSDFELRPYRAPVQIDLPGPASDLLARLKLFLAVSNQSALAISCPSINDPLYELLKALNQAQAGLSWGEGKIIYTGQKPDFDHKAIFVGNDPLNLYLIIALALLEPGTCKIIGGVNLKQQDLRPLFTVLPLLGARAVAIVPGSQGLPVRLECSAVFNSQLPVPVNCPQKLIVALLCLGSCLPLEKLTLTLADGNELNAQLAAQLTDIAQALAIRTKIAPDKIEVLPPDQEPSCFDQTTVPPDIPLDPNLCAYLLALPIYTGGRVFIQGKYPAFTTQGKTTCNLLKTGGLKLKINDTGIQSLPLGNPSPAHEISPPNAELVPLAVALACAQKHPTRLLFTTAWQPNHITDELQQLLQQLHISWKEKTNGLEIIPLREQNWPVAKITAPSPFWCLGLSLISFKRKNIILKNPGILTEIWPRFWAIYRELPTPSLHPKKSTGETDLGKKRKRIIVD